ncbi:hypothetical protein C8R43DRAFT_1061955 [Mycena crocata]|nr:hypothetical protein C8R43DRAFT_1061955 [Mycena crocata]
MLWRDSLTAHFVGVISITDFFATYLPLPPDAGGNESEDIITCLVNSSASELKKAKRAVAKAKVEDDLSESFLDYLEAVVSPFPEETKPSFDDTHTTHFPPIQPDDHYTSPDITSTRPGQQVPKVWTWASAGTVFELKYRTDIFDGDDINGSSQSVRALIQLSKSARSLLASGFCFVFVVAVFRAQARILRFDHAGFRATHAFDWTEEDRILPQFLWRLCNPNLLPGDEQARIYGEDHSISIPTEEDKATMYQRWAKTPSYKALTLMESAADMSMATATKDSRWVKAGRRDSQGNCVEVTCFTIGSPIYQSDGLFSRATRVDRVMLSDGTDNTVYALKDAWRQACRRPEADFYDLIHRYCEENMDQVDPTEVAKMAKCHGTLELSANSKYHETDSTSPHTPALERCHTRVLLTPVGSSITKFHSSKELVEGLYAAVKHHSYAYAAGVLHRDISEGNIMLDQLTREGFLVDWDYAEFTDDGLNNFNKWFPERAAAQAHPDIDKSLKELTGTFPFLAIALLKQPPSKHNAAHDLESIYWLLVWIILRHTAHTGAPDACHQLFDHDPIISAKLKSDWVHHEETPLAQSLPLYVLAEVLRLRVAGQNPQFTLSRLPALLQSLDPGLAQQSRTAPVEIVHSDFLTLFQKALTALPWPDNDEAIPFAIPYESDTLEQAVARASRSIGLHKQVVVRNHTQSESIGGGGHPPKPTGTKRGLESESASTSAMTTESGSSAGADSDASTESRKRQRLVSKSMRTKKGKPAPPEPSDFPLPARRGKGKGRANASEPREWKRRPDV